MADRPLEANAGFDRGRGGKLLSRHASRNQNCWIRMSADQAVILVSKHETGSASGYGL